MISKVVCIKSFIGDGFTFHTDQVYDYWVNFGGLNHIVRDHSGETFPFEGRDRLTLDDSNRAYIWDYFVTLDQWRESQIDKLI